MERRRGLSLMFVVCLVCQTFASPVDLRLRRESSDNEVDSKEVTTSSTSTSTESTNNSTEITDNEITSISTQNAYGFNESYRDLNGAQSAPEQATPDPFDDDSDESMESSPATGGGGGSNVFSLLRLATSLFPGSSGGGANVLIRNMIRQYLKRTQPSPVFLRRSDNDNEIKTDYTTDFKTPKKQVSAKQETEENDSNDESESESAQDDNAAEESDEDDSNGNSGNGSNGNGNNGNGNNGNGNNGNGNNDDGNGSQKQDSENDDDDDYDDEPPGGGDGQGGGILGILAGLSGGEDGQSDLGSLLAAVSGIVANLSGDGIDINALIASGLGLFVGLLSGDGENPGEILASYLLTSLDTISGGGSKNNGAFFGKFLSKLIKGTSANEGKSVDEKPKAANPLWTLKMDILRAILHFGTSVLGLASSSSSGALTN